jgi:ribose transport system ATP-binding protein/rhamnose transport system ATP-binding protein
MLEKPIWENIVQVRSIGLANDGPVLRRGALVARAAGHVARLRIKAPSPLVTVGSLSGGNQQKVVMAKWLDAAPTTILLDDPTRGVDVGARAEIHALLRGAAAGGAAVLLNSTDLEELAGACDRILVFLGGRIVVELTGADRTAPKILEAMNGGRAVVSSGDAA